MSELLDLQKTAAILSLEFADEYDLSEWSEAQQNQNSSPLDHIPFSETQYFIHSSGAPIQLQAVRPLEPYKLTGLFADKSVDHHIAENSHGHSLTMPLFDESPSVAPILQITQKLGEVFGAQKSIVGRDAIGNPINPGTGESLNAEQLDRAIRDIFVGSIALKGEDRALYDLLCVDKGSTAQMLKHVGEQLIARATQVQTGQQPSSSKVRLPFETISFEPDVDLTIGDSARIITDETLNTAPIGIFDLHEARQIGRRNFLVAKALDVQQAGRPQE